MARPRLRGKSKGHPGKFDTATMNYTGWTSDGRMFDSTERQCQSMVEGERRLIWIPENLAYQGAPYRPAGMLVVDVTLVRIRRELHQVR